MTYYYRSQQNPYQFGYNYEHYYPSAYYSYPSNYPIYRGWRSQSPKLDYHQTNFGINMEKNHANLRDFQIYNDKVQKRGKLNAEYEDRVGKIWPPPISNYRGEDWGQWGLRDSRRRIALQGYVDRIFSRY